MEMDKRISRREVALGYYKVNPSQSLLIKHFIILECLARSYQVF